MIHVLAWVCHRYGLGHADEFSLLRTAVLLAQISRSSGSQWINISITKAALEERWEALEVVALKVLSIEVFKLIFTLNTQYFYDFRISSWLQI